MPGLMQKQLLRIVQINMNRQFIVAEQLRDYCVSAQVDIALVQEPPTKGGRIPGLDHDPIRSVMGADANAGAAIIVFNPDLEVLRVDTLSEKNMAVAIVKQKHREIKTFISAYFKFNLPISESITKLSNAVAVLKSKTIIGVDTNAHSNMWFSQRNNNTGRVKGRKVEKLIGHWFLNVHNQPNQPNTYCRTDMGSSNIDVTLSTTDMVDNVRNWRVNVDITDSDHRMLSFTVLSNKEATFNQSRDRTRFHIDKADRDGFKEQLGTDIHRYQPNLTIDQGAESKVEAVTSAAKAKIPMKGKPRGKRLPPWWTPELTISNRNVNNFRKYKNYKTTDREEYKSVRNGHLSLIRKTRFNQWKDFASSANSNPWGPLYKWIKKGSSMSNVQTSLKTQEGDVTRTPMETASLLLKTLIPHDGSKTKLIYQHVEPIATANLSQVEVKDVIWRIGPKKAPGKDGLTAAILRKAWPIIKDQITHLYKRCLENSLFPTCWKDAEVVVLLKGKDKDP
ncbi:Uncharacterized protein FWK35_00020550, partial [Aphis craccivora]